MGRSFSRPWGRLGRRPSHHPEAHIRRPPKGEEVEVAELLGQAHGLVNDALGAFVVADFDEAGQREILA